MLQTPLITNEQSALLSQLITPDPPPLPSAEVNSNVISPLQVAVEGCPNMLHLSPKVHLNDNLALAGSDVVPVKLPASHLQLPPPYLHSGLMASPVTTVLTGVMVMA
jgi:hypothetical protein